MTEDACIEALREAPDEPERWAVYADLLEGRGDVRGRLIALALARKRKAERLLRDRHRKHLASPAFWTLLDAGFLKPTWAFGHLREVHVSFTEAIAVQAAVTVFDPADVDAVLASPLACALQSLSLHLPAEAWAASRALNVLRQRAPPLRRLEVSANLTADALELTGLLDALPRLQSARVLGASALPPMTTTTLESLTWWLSDWDGAPPGRLGVLEAPSLRALHLRVREESSPALTRWLREDLRAPSLRQLGLEALLTSQVLEAVADAPFAATLERLAVVVIDEASAHVLLERRRDLPRLTRLEARSFRTSQALEARVRAAFEP